MIRTFADDAAALRGDWLFPTEIRFGAGRLDELPEALARLSVRRPLIVTDRGLTATGIPARVAALAAAGGAEPMLWDGVRPNPDGATVEAGAAAAAEHAADGVIALGGGSALDAGKAVALLAGCGGDLWRFAWPGGLDHADERTTLPILALPTTAGTGAEVEPSSVITDPRGPVKAGIVNPSLMPRLVIADPELTLGLPPDLTAWTGMDALSHNLEALLVPAFHPMADAIAAAGVALCHRWLPVAVEDGGNLAARAQMMAAAIMGATAFVKGLGAMHALSHAIGALADTQHGLTNAVLMPHVLAFNRPAVEEPVARLAAGIGLAPRFDAYMEALLALSERLAIPRRLTAIGVDPADFPRLADVALGDFNAACNPRPLDRAGLLAILAAAAAGDPPRADGT